MANEQKGRGIGQIAEGPQEQRAGLYHNEGKSILKIFGSSIAILPSKFEGSSGSFGGGKWRCGLWHTQRNGDATTFGQAE
jgi:hypothetical protein